jgi:small subunit ribosomal protein S1
MQLLIREIEQSIRTVQRGDVVEGVIVHLDGEEAMVDIGLKSEGIISNREMMEAADGRSQLKVGDKVLVYVLNPESPEGHALLSLRRASAEKAWREIEKLYEAGEIIRTKVIDANKGGVIVDVGLRGFVPSSQLVSLERPSTRDASEEDLLARLQALVSKDLELKIIEVDRRRNRLILSERMAARELRNQQREKLLEDLEVGQIRRGVVSNLCSFGAFIDLGGADGLVHISELSWSRIDDPSEVLKVGQEVDVYVLSLDRESKKIGLSLKRTQDDPWQGIEERFPVGKEVKGTVIKLMSFGAFVRLEEGIEGLAHNSEMRPGIREAMQEGQEFSFRVLSADPVRHRMRLVPVGLEEHLTEAIEAAAEASEHAGQEQGEKVEAGEQAAKQ